MGISGERATRSHENFQISETLSRAIIYENSPSSGHAKGNIKNKEQIKELKILYTNADNLLNKRKDLEILIATMEVKPHVIAITEIKPKRITTKLQIGEYNLKGYEMFCGDLESMSGRGVIIYIIKEMIATILEVPITFDEGIFIKVQLSIHKV